jgi:dTDP-4-amino-4,6-dideoxygalactose transaminase
MGQKLGGRPGDCPVSESVSDRLLRLPLFCGLSEFDQQRVIEGIRAFKINSTAMRKAA